MWFDTFFLLANFLGLTVLFAVLAFWRRPGGNSAGVFLLSAAVALIVAVAELSALQYSNRLKHETPLTSPVLSPVSNSGTPQEAGGAQNPILPGNREAAGASPGLPRRILDTTGVQPNQGYQQKYQFRPGTEHYFAWRHPLIWTKALESFKGKPDIRYLEIGLFEGQSALWVLENILSHPTARLTGIDPFIEDYKFAPDRKPYKEVFFANLKLSGFENKATILEGFSQIELRKLPLGSFDIIYIDGSHDPADCLEDALLSWRLLKEGGILIFDDYLLETPIEQPPRLAIDTFYAFFGKEFEVVHVDWQVILRKKVKAAKSSSTAPPG